jgi:hypothetical protein
MDVEAANPWLSACQTPAEVAEAAGSDVGVPVWGFDPGIPVAGTGYLPVVASPARAGVCLVGAHGGAGCSTLARLSGLEDGGRAWPASSGKANAVVIVARTHAHGLEAARDAAMRYYAGQIGGVALMGLVLVADAPGRRLPGVLASAADLVAGAYPACWRVGWVERLRDGTHRCGERLPARTARVIEELAGLSTERK